MTMSTGDVFWHEIVFATARGPWLAGISCSARVREELDICVRAWYNGLYYSYTIDAREGADVLGGYHVHD